MEEMTTKQLVEELKNREAVQEIFIKPYEKIDFFVEGKKQVLQTKEGPARILVVYD